MEHDQQELGAAFVLQVPFGRSPPDDRPLVHRRVILGRGGRLDAPDHDALILFEDVRGRAKVANVDFSRSEKVGIGWDLRNQASPLRHRLGTRPS
jgi:hypothetical protein